MDLQLPRELAAHFSAETRLFELRARGPLDGLMVERWQAREALSEIGHIELIGLSTDAHLPLAECIGGRVDLLTTTADGSRTTRARLVRDAEWLAGDAGLARYRLTLVPWLWYLTVGRHNRVFQDKTVLEILEQVFADYAPIAAWEVADEVGPFLQHARARSYCVQYRESDEAFLARLLAEEGLGYRFVPDDDAPVGHSLHLFSDSTALPEDATSHSPLGGAGIRFHRAAAPEPQDTIQAFDSECTLSHAHYSATSFDYKTRANVSASLPVDARPGGEHTPVLEAYDHPGAYAWAHAGEAERYARLALEAVEARHRLWRARSTVRTLCAGTTFALTQSNLDSLAGISGARETHTPRDRQFSVTSVTHYGLNNLPSEMARRLEARLGTTPEVGAERTEAELLAAARRTGYANRFTAIDRDRPWRPLLTDGTGARHNPRPTADGPQTATVVGPDGGATPNGTDELYTDRLGRIRVRFHWQAGERPDDRLTSWVRCAQGYAGDGLGLQMMPRIGTEVLVAFLGGDIDRPIVIGATYNGVGEAGSAPTPGGHPPAFKTEPPGAVYAQAHDQRPSAQGNVAGGAAPAWHGAGAAMRAHRNSAALSGFKSKEFGGRGHNQLVFDDSDAQQRVQVASTQASSQLNLGHLIHQADNYRGSLRGTGFELRTDAYGAIRGERGLLLSTDGIDDPAPAGEVSAGVALLQAARSLAQGCSRAATTHRTPRFAAHVGADKPNQSRLDDHASPLAALLHSVNGRVAASRWAQALSDAEAGNTAGDRNQVPHSADPILTIAARAGIGTVAGEDIHLHAGETATLTSGADHHWAVGEQLRVHAGQALGLLAGAGGGGEGLHLSAAEGDVVCQAQRDQMKVQARDTLSLDSAETEFAASQRVHLANARGAAITLEGGKITITCPGKLTIHAGQKDFTGPTHMSREFNRWPEAKFDEELVLRWPYDNQPVANRAFELTRTDGAKIRGLTDANGRTSLQKSQLIDTLALELLAEN